MIHVLVRVGLYGEDGVMPVLMPKVKTPLLEKFQDIPSLLWLAPYLGIGCQHGLELICLLGALLSLGAVLLSALRDSLIYLCLWVLYLSLYTVSFSLHTSFLSISHQI